MIFGPAYDFSILRQTCCSGVAIRRAGCISPPHFPAGVKELLSSARRVFCPFCGPRTLRNMQCSTMPDRFRSSSVCEFRSRALLFCTAYCSAAIAVLGVQLLLRRATRCIPSSASYASRGRHFSLKAWAIFCFVVLYPVFHSYPRRLEHPVAAFRPFRSSRALGARITITILGPSISHGASSVAFRRRPGACGHGGMRYLHSSLGIWHIITFASRPVSRTTAQHLRTTAIHKRQQFANHISYVTIS
jgi:hypothetical protein